LWGLAHGEIIKTTRFKSFINREPDIGLDIALQFQNLVTGPVMFSLLVKTAPQRRRRRVRAERKGAAVVEAAMCIPILIVLMMGTLEVCSAIYLSESLTVCAFEACRTGVRRRATYDDVYERAVEALADRNVSLPEDGSGEPQGIVIEPTDFSSLSALDPITVTITAPTAGNSLYIFDNMLNRNFTVSVTMVREFDE
jgi:hypothetical protein